VQGALSSKGNANANLSERTVAAAESIKARLQTQEVHVKDLQFLVKPTGDLLLIDPKGIGRGVSDANMRILDRFLNP
jgi:hypothetical protein